MPSVKKYCTCTFLHYKPVSNSSCEPCYLLLHMDFIKGFVWYSPKRNIGHLKFTDCKMLCFSQQLDFNIWDIKTSDPLALEGKKNMAWKRTSEYQKAALELLVLPSMTEFRKTAALLRFLPPTPTEILTCQRSDGIPAKIAWQNASTKETLRHTTVPNLKHPSSITCPNSLDISTRYWTGSYVFRIGICRICGVCLLCMPCIGSLCSCTTWKVDGLS